MRFLVEAGGAPQLLRDEGELVCDIRLDVFAPLGQRGQWVVPDVDARIEVFAEATLAYVRAQVAVGAGDELEMAFAFLVAADGVEAFFFQRFQQHRLFVQPQFADFVKKQHAAVGAFQVAIALFHRTSERAFFVAKEGRRRAVAAQGGTVHIDKDAAHLVSRFFQFKNPPRQHRFARAGRAGEQDRGGRVERDLLDFGNHAVKRYVARGDAAFQVAHGVVAHCGKAGGECVVAGEVKVDDFVSADVAACHLPFLVAWRRGLQQDAGDLPRFDEEKEADLRDVRAGGDVYPVFFFFGVKGIACRPVVQAGIDFAEIPGVGKLHLHQIDGGVRRAVADVGAYLVGKRPVFVGVKQLDAVEDEVAALVHGDIRPPFVPAAFTAAGVELGAEEADYDAGFLSHGCGWIGMDFVQRYLLASLILSAAIFSRRLSIYSRTHSGLVLL